jgi:hypothetical protein
MNKIFSLTLLAILFLGVYSCSEDEARISENQTELTAKDIAKYHNIAVDLFEKSKANNKGEKLSIIDIQESVTELMKDNYPDLMENYVTPTKANFLTSKYVMKSSGDTDFDFNSFLNDGLNTMVSENKISQTFADEIMSLTNSDMSFSDMQNEINTLKNNNLTAYENEFLNVYESTLSASNEYWNSNTSNGKMQAKMKCSSGVIAADAVGSALGLWGSPLWSIVQGAVVSIAVNEDCKD